MKRSFSLLLLLMTDRVTDLLVARALLERLVQPHSADAGFSDAAQHSAKSLSLSDAIFMIVPDQLKDLWPRPATRRAADLVHSLRLMSGNNRDRTLAAAAHLLGQFPDDGERAAALGLMVDDLAAAVKAEPIPA